MSPVSTSPTAVKKKASAAAKKATGKKEPVAKPAPDLQTAPSANGQSVVQTARADHETPVASVKTVVQSKQRSKPEHEIIQWRIVALKVDHIVPNPYQPRLSFDEAEMQELVASVRLHGVQQPVIVRTAKADAVAQATHITFARYELVTGERRLRASREAGKKFVPAIVRDDLSDQQVAEIALVENIQRSNLTVIEEAKGYKRLMIEFRMKEERIAKKVGKSVQTIKDTLRLLALPEEVQTLLSQKKLTASHGHTLLVLAPFETVCLSVANHAATVPLTATALAADPLPNSQALKKKGLLVELGYHTKFDWANVCAACPHKAYVRSGYNSYCLKPLEWKSKQDAAVELQKQEAARIMEEARQASSGTVDVDMLPAGSYFDLSYRQTPSGCSGSCPCRSEAADPRDPTKKIAICLDPNRFNELKEAERQAHQEQRQRRATDLWNEAKAALESDVSRGDEQRAAFLVAMPIVRGERMRWGGDPEDWQQMVMQVSKELGLFPDWDTFFDPDTDQAGEFAVLQELDSAQLLLLAACLLLAQEAMSVVRFAGETPHLSFVLGHDRVSQLELEEQPGEKNGEEVLREEPLPGGILPDGDLPEDGSEENATGQDSSLEEDLPEDWPTEAELREAYAEDDKSEVSEELDGIGADDFNAAAFAHSDDEQNGEIQSHEVQEHEMQPLTAG